MRSPARRAEALPADRARAVHRAQRSGRVIAHRAGALERVQLLSEDWQLTKARLAETQGANGPQAEAGLPGAGGPAQLPRRVSVAVFTGDARDGPGPVITWLIGGAGQTVLVVHCAIRDVARYPLGRLTKPAAQRAPSPPAARSR